MWRDNAYLLDILIAARRAIEFLQGMTREAFEQSELHQNAVVRHLEIIGRAARGLSQETRDAHPDIPWDHLLGMRNRLVYAYFRVNVGAVWKTVQNDLPPLIAQIEPLVPPQHEN